MAPEYVAFSISYHSFVHDPSEMESPQHPQLSDNHGSLVLTPQSPTSFPQSVVVHSSFLTPFSFLWWLWLSGRRTGWSWWTEKPSPHLSILFFQGRR